MTLIISDDFPFPVGDMDDIPEDILRRFHFIDEDISCGEESMAWTLLVQSVARELAVSSVHLNIQSGKSTDTDLRTLHSLKKDAQRLREQAEDFLSDVWFHQHPFPDGNATPQLLEAYATALDDSNNSRSKDLLRRRFKIEMAMHEWKNWSPNMKHQLPQRLKQLDDIGLNARDIFDSGAGFCRNPSVPILQPDANFVARFRIYNPGPTTWPPGCYGKYTTEDTPNLFGGGGKLVTTRIPHAVKPGEDAVLEVPMRTPPFPGPENDNPSMFHHMGWRMVTPGGVFFGFYFYYQYAVRDGWQSRASARSICNVSKPTKEEVDKTFAKRPSRHGCTPRSSQSYRILSQVRRIIKYVSPITEKLLSHLKPSEIAALKYAIGVKLTDSYHWQYLSPIREFPRYTAYLERALKSGHKVTLAGTDMKLFMDRITRPNKFWSQYLRSPPILIWLAVISERPLISRPADDKNCHYEWLACLEGKSLEIQPPLQREMPYRDKHLPSINPVAIKFFGWTRDRSLYTYIEQEIRSLSKSADFGVILDGHGFDFVWKETSSLIQGLENNFVNVHANPLTVHTITDASPGPGYFGGETPWLVRYFCDLAQGYPWGNVTDVPAVISRKRGYDADDNEDTGECAKKKKELIR